MSNPGYASWNQLQDLYKTIGPFYNSSTVSNDYSNNGSADDAALPSNTDKVTTYNAGVGQSKEKEDTSTNFDLDRFESLLNRLEASKGRQQRQKSVEGRRDIFSQGLAGMMSNF